MILDNVLKYPDKIKIKYNPIHSIENHKTLFKIKVIDIIWIIIKKKPFLINTIDSVREMTDLISLISQYSIHLLINR